MVTMSDCLQTKFDSLDTDFFLFDDSKKLSTILQKEMSSDHGNVTNILSDHRKVRLLRCYVGYMFNGCLLRRKVLRFFGKYPAG